MFLTFELLCFIDADDQEVRGSVPTSTPNLYFWDIEKLIFGSNHKHQNKQTSYWLELHHLSTLQTAHWLQLAGRPLHTAMALNPAANQYTRPARSTKVCFIAFGNITTIVNKGSWAVAMSSLFLQMSMVHIYFERTHDGITKAAGRRRDSCANGWVIGSLFIYPDFYA